MGASIYWYDLETSGTAPLWDRILQFAGLRTDLELRPLGDEYATYVRLPDDVIPDVEAALVTGLTPQRTRREGVSEWQALSRINALFSVPGTCVAGYNNLRFDDEFVRHGLYRNLMDPYAREWRDGNSRWDILDLARAAGALRPQGIEWPKDDEGLPVYRLEALAAANGLAAGQAHDAAFDVRATVALARLLRQRQPKLFAYFFAARGKRRIRQLLQPYGDQVRIHISGMYPRSRCGFAPVVSICAHPTNSNAIIVADVSQDLSPLLEWPAERLREALFGADAAQRPPLKQVRVNKCPFVAPLSVLRPADVRRLGLDKEAAERRRKQLRRANLAGKMRKIYAAEPGPPPADVEGALYGGFFADDDQARCRSFQRALQQGDWLDLDYQDARLPQLASRMKARCFPQQLTAQQEADWRTWVGAKINAAQEVPWRTLAAAQAQLDQVRAQAQGNAALLDDLGRHFLRLAARYP